MITKLVRVAGDFGRQRDDNDSLTRNELDQVRLLVMDYLEER